MGDEVVEDLFFNPTRSVFSNAHPAIMVEGPPLTDNSTPYPRPRRSVLETGAIARMVETPG